MKKITFYWLILLNTVLTVRAQQTIADSLFQAKNWAESIKAYQHILEKEPANRPGFQWNQIGQCYYNLKNWNGAKEAYEKAISYTGNTTVMYNLACVYALRAENDSALEWLDRAANNGYTLYKGVMEDPDLDTIKSSLRLPVIVNKMKRNAEPCSFEPTSHQFDFWIGHWKVYNTQGQQVGTSEVDQILGECVIFENWTDYFGNQGKSFNFYNATEKKWQQTWVDDKGGVTEFYDGTYENGKLFFPKSRPQSDLKTGKQIINRLTFFNSSPTQVRQLGERSEDGGKTWQTQYDLKYIRQ